MPAALAKSINRCAVIFCILLYKGLCDENTYNFLMNTLSLHEVVRINLLRVYHTMMGLSGYRYYLTFSAGSNTTFAMGREANDYNCKDLQCARAKSHSENKSLLATNTTAYLLRGNYQCRRVSAINHPINTPTTSHSLADTRQPPNQQDR